MSRANPSQTWCGTRRIDDDGGGIGGGGQKLERFPTLSAKECHPFFFHFFFFFSLYSSVFLSRVCVCVSKVFQKPHEKPRQ
jgi:hypothetical protein